MSGWSHEINRDATEGTMVNATEVSVRRSFIPYPSPVKFMDVGDDRWRVRLKCRTSTAAIRSRISSITDSLLLSTRTIRSIGDHLRFQGLTIERAELSKCRWQGGQLAKMTGDGISRGRSFRSSPSLGKPSTWRREADCKWSKRIRRKVELWTQL